MNKEIHDDNELECMAEKELEDISARDIKTMLLEFTFRHGPWAVLASILLAAQMGWIRSPVFDSLQDHEYDNILRHNQLVAAINYNSALLRAVCLNFAKDEDQRGHCQPIYLKEYPPK